MAKKIAVVLSGCGYQDGTEITEAVSLIINLTQAGAEITYFAPDEGFSAQNFLTGETLSESRNLMVEASRITRGQMNDLESLVADDFDGLAMPGGFGAALHLSTWATQGSACKVIPHLEKVIRDFHQQSKPIAAICIAPVLLAKVLGKEKISLTIGNDADTIAQITKTGAIHETCPVDDYITDRSHKIITTPAYMYADASAAQVFQGISGLTSEFLEMS